MILFKCFLMITQGIFSAIMYNVLKNKLSNYYFLILHKKLNQHKSTKKLNYLNFRSFKDYKKVYF